MTALPVASAWKLTAVVPCPQVIEPFSMPQVMEVHGFSGGPASMVALPPPLTQMVDWSRWICGGVTARTGRVTEAELEQYWLSVAVTVSVTEVAPASGVKSTAAPRLLVIAPLVIDHCTFDQVAHGLFASGGSMYAFPVEPVQIVPGYEWITGGGMVR